MILILAGEEDRIARLLSERVVQTGGQVLALEGELLQQTSLCWRPERPEANWLAVPGRAGIRGRDLSGVLQRLRLGAVSAWDGAATDRAFIRRETSAAWTGFLAALDCPVIDRPVPGRLPQVLMSEAGMGSVLGSSGFSSPQACLTRRPDEACRFYESGGMRAFFTSLGGMFPPHALFGEPGLEELTRCLPEGPALLHSIPPGPSYRVFTVGSDVLAQPLWETVNSRDSRIRITPADMDPAALPEPIAVRCRTLREALFLSSAEMTIVVEDPGRVHCLSIGAPGADCGEGPFGIAVADALRSALCREAEVRLP